MALKTQEQVRLWNLIDSNGYDTLFVDRDGAIIERLPDGSPVTSPSQVKMLPAFLKVAAALAADFRTIIVFSTYDPQRGARPDKATEDAINDMIRRNIEEAGGRVDAFYSDYYSAPGEAAAHLSGPLLPLIVRRDFPSISFAHSVMVGDVQSDRLLAYNCGMKFFSLNGDVLIDTLVDFDAIEDDFNLLRKCIMNFTDVLQKLMNSAVRIQGLRLAARCCCHALALKKKIVMVFDIDSGFDARHIPNDLKLVMREHSHSRHVVSLSPDGDEPITERLARVCEPNDVVIFFAASSSSREMVKTMERARELGAVTVAITGAKPGGLDLSDVIIKVPSLMIAHIQGSFKTIMAMLYVLIGLEIDRSRIF